MKYIRGIYDNGRYYKYVMKKCSLGAGNGYLWTRVWNIMISKYLNMEAGNGYLWTWVWNSRDK